MIDTYTTEAGASAPTAYDQESFLRATYGHLFGAVLAFIGLEYVLFTTGIAAAIADP